MLVMMLLAWAPWLILGGAGLFLAMRFTRAYERRGVTAEEVAQLWERIEGLEATIASHDAEMQQLVERQQFAERMLANQKDGAND